MPMSITYNKSSLHVVVLDILNCMINDHNCSQICVEVEGSFNCSCYSGYELQENRVTCAGTYACKYDFGQIIVRHYLCMYFFHGVASG